MRLYDNRAEFYQYDTNQKLICDECTVGEEIHFSTRFYKDAAICLTYEFEGYVVVDVPNVYLMHSSDLVVYRMYIDDGRSTVDRKTFRVNPRKKPSDYVYTETEVKSYEALEKRIEALEQNGGSSFIETDPTVPAWAKAETKPTYTADEVGALSTEDLPEAVNLALKQAKESGEFNGKDGEDGYSPVKGTDYFTEADKTEIVNAVLVALPTAEGGSF